MEICGNLSLDKYCSVTDSKLFLAKSHGNLEYQVRLKLDELKILTECRWPYINSSRFRLYLICLQNIY